MWFSFLGLAEKEVRVRMDKLGTGEGSRDGYFRSRAGSKKQEMI